MANRGKARPGHAGSELDGGEIMHSFMKKLRTKMGVIVPDFILTWKKHLPQRH
jgi:hypothetical protein